MAAAIAGASVAIAKMNGATSVEAAAGGPVLLSVNNTTSGGTTSIGKDATVPGPVVSLTNGNGDGIAVTGTTIGVNVLGFGKGVFAAANTDSGTGVYAQMDKKAGFGVVGTCADNSTGVWGNSGLGNGVLGISGATHAVYGTVSVASAAGVFGENNNANGTGVNGKSDNGVGVQGNAVGGTGVSAVSGSGTALVARSSSKSAQFFGAFEVTGDVNITGNFLASGTKSAAVKIADGSTRLVYCIESPVSYFEDIGTGSVSDGHGHVAIDPNFASTVITADYVVFLTPEGDCQGLYVEGKTATGFNVSELMGGTSSVNFSYRIVAKRAGIKNERFAPVTLAAPESSAQRVIPMQTVQLPTLPSAPAVPGAGQPR